jgi:hypothetical protein
MLCSIAYLVICSAVKQQPFISRATTRLRPVTRPSVQNFTEILLIVSEIEHADKRRDSSIVQFVYVLCDSKEIIYLWLQFCSCNVPVVKFVSYLTIRALYLIHRLEPSIHLYSSHASAVLNASMKINLFNSLSFCLCIIKCC